MDQEQDEVVIYWRPDCMFCLDLLLRLTLALLLEDPPLSYATISAALGIPAGSIGPTRAGCLHKLRRHPAIAALTDADTHTTTSHQPTRAARRPRPRPQAHRTQPP